MIKEKLCDLFAAANGFKKTSVSENLVVENTGCLVNILSNNGAKVCSGICGKCRKKVTKGKFNGLSSGSLTENSKSDTWHL